MTGDRLHSVQWEVLMVGRLFKFYRRHAHPSAKYLLWLTASHLLHHPYHCVKHYYPRQIAGTNLPTPMGWNAWLARTHVYVHNLLRVITRLNPMARSGIEPRSTGPRPHSIPMYQPHRTLQYILHQVNLVDWGDSEISTNFVDADLRMPLDCERSCHDR